MIRADRYRAIDCSEQPTRYLHLSGTSLTTDQFWSWSGTPAQFEAICELHGWDNLNLIHVDKLPK